MPTLTIVQGPDKGQVLTVSEERPLLLGRASAQARLTDFSISRRHAEIRHDAGGWMLEDLKSSNGTYLNSRRVERAMRLKPGDQIQLGGTLLIWNGREDRPEPARPSRTDTTRIALDAAARRRESPIIETVASSDDSVILASPAAAEAVRAWRVLSTLLEAVGAVSTPEQILERTMDVLFEELPIDHGFILMRSPETGTFEPRVTRSAAEPAEKIRANRSIVDYVIERRTGVLSSNAMVDERFERRREAGGGIGLQSVLCVPIGTTKEMSGVIHLDVAIQRHIYTEEQLRLATAIGRMAALAVENAQLVSDRVRTERLAATGETVAALSHHIKNILQGIMGGSDVVEMGLHANNLATVDQGYQVVRRNLEKILSLSMNMLAFAKKREPRLESVQFNALAAEALELVQRRAEDKAVLVRSELEDGIPPILLDRDGIHQVLLNLLHNALDAVPKSTGAVTVRTAHDTRRGQVILTIGDNGPGISEQMRGHLFDAFHSTKGQGGTGLGLAVARKIVEEHYGSISASSIPGQGTILRVALPVVQPTGIDSAATHGPGTG